MSTFAGGYAGQILYVNLSDGSIEIRPLEHQFALDYIGGRGFSSRILWDEVKPGTDPISHENVLVIAAGPLNGTPAPSASRLVVAAKSPMSGALGDSNSGGYWAPELKYAGFDGIVIYGKAETPVYLWIEDGQATLRPAKHLWGQKVGEVNKTLKEEIGDEDVHILTIGPAGENLVRYGCVITDGESAGGRCGIGAVMGSKCLKAVVVRGSLDVRIADPQRFKETIDAYRETLTGEAWTETLRKLGTPNLTAHRQSLGIWGAKNFQRGTIEEYDKISGETFNRRFLVKALGCMGCLVRCRRYSALQVSDFTPIYGKGPEYESINALAAKPYITDPEIVLHAHFLCDEYGMDVHGVGSSLAMAMELYERGLLRKDEVDGQELVFGNGEALLYFIHRVAGREGFGDLLAEGTRVMGRRLNGDYYAIQVKGLDVTASDPRKSATRALAYSVATRGSCHLRANPYIDEFIKPEEAESYFGTPGVSDPGSLDGKGRMVAWSEDWVTLSDQLGLCKFAWYRSRNFQMLIKRGLELARDLFVSATGLPMTVEDFYRCGERAYNVEKLFNLREGIGRESDYPPERFFKEELQDGSTEGCKLDRKEYERLLHDYYAARGWDIETGVPTMEKLRSLGLQEAQCRPSTATE